MRTAVLTVATVGLLASPVATVAQDFVRPLPPYELNVHAGAFYPDSSFLDDSTEFLLGLRFFLNLPSGFGFGGNFDWIPRGSIEVGGDLGTIDVNTFLYTAELNYMWPLAEFFGLFVGAGVGAATTRFDNVPEGFNNFENDLLIPIGLGIKWFDESDTPTWAFRAEVRDNIIWSEDLAGSTAAGNNWELSAGFSFLFGD